MNQFENEYEADTLSASQQALRVLKPTVLAVAMGCVGSAWAAQGGVVVNGTGNIATSGTTTTVTQSTDKMVVNWSNFDIAQGQTVKFAQPTTSAAVLNRVTGPVKASDIQGTLSANGRVYVVNPAGVMFGSTAVVNADSVVASTLDINAQQFMAGGRVAGNQKLLDLTSNAANASVVNQGQINARQVALLGANVVNKGTINATGDVTLGAADTATLSLTNSGFSVALDAPEVNALVDNGGVIVSKGGNVMLTAAATGDAVRNAVRSTGTIEARRATTGAGGSIELRSDADGQIAVGGKLTADDRVTVGTAPRITTGKGRSIVVDAITNLDQRTVNNTTQIDNITNQINNGGIGLVQQATPGSDVTVAKDTGGKAVNFTGTDGDRVLSGIAAGSADNEAVNVKQLKDAGVIDPSGHAKSVVTYDNTDKTSLTLGGEGASAPVAIHNVADGVGDRDAVNVGQLNQRLADGNAQTLSQANAYTDQKFNDVWQNMGNAINEVNQQANRGIAAASALINVTPYVPGHTAVNAGVASYRGEAALGVGVSRWSDNGRVNLNAGVSASKGDQPVFRVGVGYVF